MLKTKYDEIDKNLKIKDNDLIVVAGVEWIGKNNFISNIIVNMEKPVLLIERRLEKCKYIYLKETQKKLNIYLYTSREKI